MASDKDLIHTVLKVSPKKHKQFKKPLIIAILSILIILLFVKFIEYRRPNSPNYYPV